MPEKEEVRIYKDAIEFRNKVRIKTDKKNILFAGNLACLSIVIFDDTGNTPLANTDYRIEGPDNENYSGTTDENGYLYHPDVTINNYKLTAGESTVIVPVVLKKEDRHLQRIIDFQIS